MQLNTTCRRSKFGIFWSSGEQTKSLENSEKVVLLTDRQLETNQEDTISQETLKARRT